MQMDVGLKNNVVTALKIMGLYDGDRAGIGASSGGKPADHGVYHGMLLSTPRPSHIDVTSASRHGVTTG
jgi:hypothetical protein